MKQYIEACQLDHDRLARTSAWSRRMQKIGYRTEFQARGDELAFAQTKIALGEAQNMFDRLTKQTGPKLMKALEANVKAIESDKYTQDASFNLEKIRLERIRKNIKNCTLYAPADGVVVYANQSNAFGMVTFPIAEGVTVRQDQPIINLPDPLHMHVKPDQRVETGAGAAGPGCPDQRRRVPGQIDEGPRAGCDGDQYAAQRFRRSGLLRERGYRAGVCGTSAGP